MGGGPRRIIPERAHRLRKALGLTQKQVATRAGTGVNQSDVSDVELDNRPEPSAYLVVALAIALQTTGYYLLGVTDDPGPSKPEPGDETLERKVRSLAPKDRAVVELMVTRLLVGRNED